VDFQASFSAAVRHYENLDYEQALEQLSRARALAQGIEQEAAVTLYQGLVQAELGQRVQSLDSFRTSLYLKPDAKLPVKVSPKVERDFEDVRQSVLRDLGISSPDPQASADRPMQTPGLTALVAPPSQTPAYVPSVGTEPASGRGPLLPVVFLGAGALAGGAAGFFGLQSQTNVRLAREATFYDERAARLKSAEGQAFVANILFGTAGAAALGALVTFFIPGSSHPPASASTEGTP
jgi:tetratricopeptide (TPR) repeat protein